MAANEIQMEYAAQNLCFAQTAKNNLAKFCTISKTKPRLYDTNSY